MASILAQAEDTADTATGTETVQTTATEVDVVCGNQGAFCDALLEWTGNEAVAETTAWVIGTPVKILLIAVAALIVNRIMRRIISRSVRKLGTVTAHHGDGVVAERNVERAEARAATIGSLLRSVTTATVYSIALVMILETMGVGIVAIIASAGIVGIAIGFGAQSIVEDFLRGVFMLAEDQFGVGDRIDVGHVNGYVERVTLRTAVIRAADGTLWHVPNSEIARVANENQLTSRALVEIGVSYGADIGEAMAVLARASEEAADDPSWKEHVTRPPEVSGIQDFGADDVRLRVIVWVDAGERRRFERYLRLKLKEALDQAAIEMPNRQIDVYLREVPQSA